MRSLPPTDNRQPWLIRMDRLKTQPRSVAILDQAPAGDRTVLTGQIIIGFLVRCLETAPHRRIGARLCDESGFVSGWRAQPRLNDSPVARVDLTQGRKGAERGHLFPRFTRRPGPEQEVYDLFEKGRSMQLETITLDGGCFLR